MMTSFEFLSKVCIPGARLCVCVGGRGGPKNVFLMLAGGTSYAISLHGMLPKLVMHRYHFLLADPILYSEIGRYLDDTDTLP